MSTPFKMKATSYGGPMRKNFPSVFKDTGDHKHPHDPDLVTHTDPNQPRDWGSASTTQYETLVSKKTQRLIDAGAPEKVIEKSKASDIKRFKESNKT